MRATQREDVCVYFPFLTFGPSQHKAETLAVFFLQKHRLLLDYIVTGRGGDGERVTATRLRQKEDTTLLSSAVCFLRSASLSDDITARTNVKMFWL